MPKALAAAPLTPCRPLLGYAYGAATKSSHIDGESASTAMKNQMSAL